MCLLIAFGSRIECLASKNDLFDHLETAVNNVDVVKVKFVIVLYAMLVSLRLL